MVLRIVLTVVAVQLLALPYLQMIGGALLLWIGVQLLAKDAGDAGEEKGYGAMMAAIRTILIADLVMRLDNVIALAAAAKGSVLLLVLSLAINIPMVIFGSTLMIRLMERFPIVVTFGAALIGWVGGETVVSDKVLAPLVENAHWLHQAGPALGAALVLLLGRWLQKHHDKDEVPAPQALAQGIAEQNGVVCADNTWQQVVRAGSPRWHTRPIAMLGQHSLISFDDRKNPCCPPFGIPFDNYSQNFLKPEFVS